LQSNVLGKLPVTSYQLPVTDLEPGIYYRENGQIKNTGGFRLTHDLNSLPFIDRALTKAHLYGEKWKKYNAFFYTQAGRDCWWNKCAFCSWRGMYPDFRQRTPDNLLDEIGLLIEQHGAREIFDDTGTFPAGSWLEDFCQGLIKRGYNKKITFSCNMNFLGINEKSAGLMKQANFRKIKMGLESANQKTLDALNKGISVGQVMQGCKMISGNGLDIHLTVMVGFPWETKLEALNTLRLSDTLMKKGWIEMLQATVLVPYPGTEIYELGLKNSWFRFSPYDYERFDMSEPVFNAPDMSPREVMDICRKTYKTFLSPRFILRNLSRIRSVKDLVYDLKGLKAVAGHISDFGRKKN
jgi:anaerobic magnesium-protoporphyrin IX monomethyl ester cyclase